MPSLIVVSHPSPLVLAHRPGVLAACPLPEVGSAIPLGYETTLFSRDPSLASMSEPDHVAILLPVIWVNRRHAIIRHVDPMFVLEDLRSRNGVILNGQRMGPWDREVLRDGDEINIVDFRFVFRRDSEPS